MNVATALAASTARPGFALSALDMDELEMVAGLPDNRPALAAHIDNLSDFAWQRLDRALSKVRATEGPHHGEQ